MNKLNLHGLNKLSNTKEQQTLSTRINHSIKLPLTQRKSSRSLNQSVLSTKSQNKNMSQMIKLPDSYYNDRQQIYAETSRYLSQKKLSFQSRNITFSQRKKYELNKTENIINKRKHSAQIQNIKDFGKYLSDKGQLIRKSSEAKSAIKKRYQNLMDNKYKRLVFGELHLKVNKNVLDRSLKRSFSQRIVKKWESPFKGQNNMKTKFLGQEIVSKKIQKLYGNQDPTQLKILNLDRLFRQKDGKLSNILPLPMPKFSSVTSRSNMIKVVKSKDRLYDIMNEFNALLRLMNLKKTVPRLGIKGTNFTKSPTIEELMGIKLSLKRQIKQSEEQFISQQMFISHCQYYKLNIKKNILLTRRLLNGLIQQQQIKGLSLRAFTRFHLIFVHRTAAHEDKVNFLAYFFISYQEKSIPFHVLRLILEIMCKDLPNIQKLNLKTDILSKEEKSRIFLQALNRVLFGDIQKDVMDKQGIRMQLLRIILQHNPDACDLLINLLQIQ